MFVYLELWRRPAKASLNMSRPLTLRYVLRIFMLLSSRQTNSFIKATMTLRTPIIEEFSQHETVSLKNGQEIQVLVDLSFCPNVKSINVLPSFKTATCS